MITPAPQGSSRSDDYALRAELSIAELVNELCQTVSRPDRRGRDPRAAAAQTVYRPASAPCSRWISREVEVGERPTSPHPHGPSREPDAVKSPQTALLLCLLAPAAAVRTKLEASLRVAGALFPSTSPRSRGRVSEVPQAPPAQWTWWKRMASGSSRPLTGPEFWCASSRSDARGLHHRVRSGAQGVLHAAGSLLRGNAGNQSGRTLSSCALEAGIPEHLSKRC